MALGAGKRVFDFLLLMQDLPPERPKRLNRNAELIPQRGAPVQRTLNVSPMDHTR
jgi:hypothetical protein